jgi:hypothetical protein
LLLIAAKRSLRVASGLFWKPFDARFEEFLGALRYHADLVNKELLLAQLWETKEGKASIAAQIEGIKDRIAKVESGRKTTESVLNSPGGKEQCERTLAGKYLTLTPRRPDISRDI